MVSVGEELLNPIYWIVFIPIGTILGYYIYFKWIPEISKLIVYSNIEKVIR